MLPKPPTGSSNVEDGNPAIVALELSNGPDDLAAAQRVLDAGLPLYYWIEVGRCPNSPTRTRSGWRAFRPTPNGGAASRSFQWKRTGRSSRPTRGCLCLYKETFAAHLARIETMLGKLPAPRGIFLNDLQGPPSACGCGHPLCRWTADYGPIKTATPLGPAAAANFCSELGKLVPGCEIIPVLTPECEESDRETVCGGVNCYRGLCWKEWSRQAIPLVAACPRIAALVPYKVFARDLPIYGDEAAWVGHAVRSFGRTPQGARPVPAGSLFAIVQGWAVTPEEIRAQEDHAIQAGCAGVIVAESPIEQGFEPRLHRWRN